MLLRLCNLFTFNHRDSCKKFLRVKYQTVSLATLKYLKNETRLPRGIYEIIIKGYFEPIQIQKMNISIKRDIMLYKTEAKGSGFGFIESQQSVNRPVYPNDAKSCQIALVVSITPEICTEV